MQRDWIVWPGRTPADWCFVAFAAHQLAPSCNHAFTTVTYMATFRYHVQQLHLYFCRSASRISVLGPVWFKSYAERKTNIPCHLWLAPAVPAYAFISWFIKYFLAGEGHMLAVAVIMNLQCNLCAVLAALAEESEVKQVPISEGAVFVSGIIQVCHTSRCAATPYPHVQTFPDCSVSFCELAGKI